MSIQSIQGYNLLNSLNSSTAPSNTIGNERAASAGQGAVSSRQSVNLSQEAKNLNLSTAVYSLDTNQGRADVDLSSYFEPPKAQRPIDLDSAKLLMPSADNLKALQSYISDVFPNFLSQHNIPEAPDRISYDNQGQPVLPADYPYAAELQAALDKDPSMSRALQSSNALASHYAALQELQPFHTEYAQAQTQAEIDAVLSKYASLFSDDRSYPQISLTFSDRGELSIRADNEQLLA